MIGHSRRVGLIEWHPTAENLLLSSAYDYKVRSQIKAAVLEIIPEEIFCLGSRSSSGTCPRKDWCSGVRCVSSWHPSTTASHQRCCCCPSASIRKETGLQLHPKTDAFECWTLAQEGLSRCVFVLRDLWPCVTLCAVSAGVLQQVSQGKQGCVHRRLEDAAEHRLFALEPQTDRPLGPGKII